LTLQEEADGMMRMGMPYSNEVASETIAKIARLRLVWDSDSSLKL
jgi:hypothetical protein